MTLLYSRHFDNAFHFDDFHTIVANPAIQTLNSRILTDATAFSSLPSNQTWRPLVTLTLALDYQLADGLNAWAFHLDSFAWFLALLTGFYLLARKLTPRPLLAAAILACHPVMAETVNYIIQRGDMMAAVGWVWGIYLYARNHRAWPLPFWLAALAKPTALVFPLLLLAYMLFIEKRLRKAEFALALLSAMALTLLHQHFLPNSFRTGGPDLASYLWTQPAIIAFYLGSFLAPLHLVADTDWECFPSPWHPLALLGDGVLLGLLLIILKVRGRAGFGLSWFLLGLCLTSVTPLAEITNDHRMCLAYPGLILSACQLRRFPKILVLAWLGVLCCLTWQRNEVWHSEESLWLDVTRKSPASGRGWMNYGLTQLKAGRLTVARQALEKATQLTPYYALAHLNLGICQAAQGQLEQASTSFERAEQLDPNSPEVPFYRARWQFATDRDQARDQLRRALRLRPQHVPAWQALCQLDLEAQDWRAAEADLELARPYPEYATLLPEWRDRLTRGQRRELEVARKSLRSAENHVQLSFVLWKQRRLQESLQAAEQGLQRFPREARLFNNKAAVFLDLKRWKEAEACARKALELDPGFEVAKNNLQFAQDQSLYSK